VFIYIYMHNASLLCVCVLIIIKRTNTHKKKTCWNITFEAEREETANWKCGRQFWVELVSAAVKLAALKSAQIDLGIFTSADGRGEIAFRKLTKMPLKAVKII